MDGFCKIVMESFDFLNRDSSSIEIVESRASGHDVVLWKSPVSNYDLVFYQDLNKYQIQLIPSSVDNSKVALDLPFALKIVDENLTPTRVYEDDTALLLEKHWEALQTLFEDQNIRDTVKKVKELKKEYQNSKWS